MFRNIKANLWESSLALFVLIISSWQALDAMATLYPQIGKGRSSQFSPIKIDKAFIISNTSATDSACLGYLEGSFERTLERASYSLKGELFLSIGDKMLPTKVDMEVSFNVLGQLAAAVLKISNISSNLTLGWLNVNPIEITLLTSGEGFPARREKFSLPGPMLLKELGDEFILDYPVAGKSIPLAIENYPIASLLNIKLTTLPDAKSQCQAGTKSSLDLISTSTELRSRLTKILPQLPPGLFPQLSSN